MSLAPLSSIAGFVAGTVSNGIQRIADGLSFASVLATPKTELAATGDAPRTDNHADDLRQKLAAALKQFQDAVHRRFASAGIDTSVPVMLQSDGLGGVVTDGRHPDRLAIEQLFANDEALTAAFHQLAAQQARVQSLDAQSNEADGPLADSRFSLLLSDDKISIAP